MSPSFAKRMRALNDVMKTIIISKGNRILKIISRECGKITDPSEARTHDP